VARTHSRYWKLIKFYQASPPFLSFPYYRRSTSIQIQIQLSNYQIHQKLTQAPCKHSTHTLVCSLHLIAMLYYRMLPHFPTFHIVFHLPFLTATSNRLETFTMLKPSSARIQRGVTRLGSHQLSQSRKSRLPVFSAILNPIHRKPSPPESPLNPD